MNVASCRSCGRHIIWSTSPDGKKLPLDARPVTVYSLDESVDPPRAVKREHHDTVDNVSKPVKVYVNHFVTCPSAALHSRSALRAEAEA